MALILVLGTAAGLRFHAHTPFLIGAAWLLAALTAVTAKARSSGLFLLCGIFLAAWANASLHENSPAPRHLSALITKSREHVELIGIVADDPMTDAGGVDLQERRRFTLRVSALRRAGGWQRATGNVSVSWRGTMRDKPLEYGQQWKLRGVLSRDAVRRTGLWTGPAHRFQVDEVDEILLAEGRGSRFIRYCLATRRACARVLEAGVEEYPDSHNLVKAMLLGYRGDVSPGLREAFSVTGTLHVLAVSGLHVGILMFLCITLLRTFGVPGHRHALYLLPLLLAYAVLTGLRASAVRASLMAAVLLTAPLCGRRPNVTAAVAIAASLILVACPGQLLDLGFIFSFSAVIGLLVLQPRIMRLCRIDDWASDPWTLQKPGRFQYVWRWVVAGGLGTAATSVAVWAVTAPLTAKWFNLCSPIALIGNLLVLPLAFVVILAGVLSAVLGGMYPVAAEVFNHANRVFVELLLIWIDKLSHVSWGFFRVGPISDMWFVVWYLFLFLLVFSRSYLRRMLAPMAGMAIVVAAVCGWMARNEARMVLSDTGDSMVVLVEAPRSRPVLVNAGPAFRAQELIRSLRGRGVNGFEALIIGHADAAHAGGAVEIMRAFPVRALWCSPWVEQSPVCRAVLREAESRGIAVHRRVAGDRGMLGGIEWEVLHPSADATVRRSSEGALVLRFARCGASVLLMNGADASVEQSILARATDPAAEVIVAGGRRMKGSCSVEWLDAVRPRTVLVAGGAGIRRMEPDRDVLLRLRHSGAEVLLTDESGMREIVFGREPDYPGGGWCRIGVSR